LSIIENNFRIGNSLTGAELPNMGDDCDAMSGKSC